MTGIGVGTGAGVGVGVEIEFECELGFGFGFGFRVGVEEGWEGGWVEVERREGERDRAGAGAMK